MTAELDKAEQAPGAEWSGLTPRQAELCGELIGLVRAVAEPLNAALAAKEAECEALRVEVERWAEQANKEDECRQTWQARAMAAEKERTVLIEDRARFPARPDGIGQMIEAHIGNLKAGKKSSDDYANQWHSRMVAAEAKLKRMESALKQCAEAPHSGWTIAQALARAALASEDSAE